MKHLRTVSLVIATAAFSHSTLTEKILRMIPLISNPQNQCPVFNSPDSPTRSYRRWPCCAGASRETILFARTLHTVAPSGQA